MVRKMVLRLTRFFRTDLNNSFYTVHDNLGSNNYCRTQASHVDNIKACVEVDVEMWLCWWFDQDCLGSRLHSISSH